MDYIDPNRQKDPVGPGNYPKTLEPVVTPASAINVDNWDKADLPYVFSVENHNDFTEFPLPLNPQSINQSENFAISIRPSQGGTVVNHSGVRYGDITITGTTGQYPNAGMAGASVGSIFVKDTKNLKNKSGYEVFLLLRNYLKAYYEIKATDQQAKSARLVFKNYKDGEFLIVEILKFTMDRNVANRTMYDYNITMKIIGRESGGKAEMKANLFGDILTPISNTLLGAIETVNAGRALVSRGYEILQSISEESDRNIIEPLRKVSLFMKSVMGLRPSVADLSKRTAGLIADQMKINNEVFLEFKNETNSNAKNPEELSKELGTATGISADTVLTPDQLETLREEMDNIRKTTRSDLINVKNQLLRTIELLQERIEKKNFRSEQDYDLMAGLEMSQKGVTSILSRNELFKSEYSQEIARVQGDFGFQLAIEPSEAMAQVRISQGDTLERIALRELGDAERWPELAILNNLVSPFIVGFGKIVPNTKKVGDLLLIPKPSVFGFRSQETVNESIETKGLSEIEKNQGVDLKIDLNSEDPVGKGDLLINDRGDLELSVGGGNAAQAILIKLLLEKGDLIDYPEIGSNLLIGRRDLRVEDLRSSIIRTMTADERFERIENLSVVRDGGALMVSFEVYLAQVDTPIPVSFQVSI